MKHQYFGDEDDFKKYGILRELNKVMGEGISVCWMLTQDDGSRDGLHTEYIEKPWEWRNCDPELFDFLNRCVSNRTPRHVSLAKDILKRPPALFFDHHLPEDTEGRKQYFEELSRHADGQGLVFFDPDIGLAPQSVVKGNAGSDRYLFWDEMTWFYFRKKQSVLVYQHFPRVNRNHFIGDAVNRIMLDTRAPEIYSLRTNRVVFFLVPQETHSQMLERACVAIARKWQRHIEVWQHPQPKRLM